MPEWLPSALGIVASVIGGLASMFVVTFRREILAELRRIDAYAQEARASATEIRGQLASALTALRGEVATREGWQEVIRRVQALEAKAERLAEQMGSVTGRVRVLQVRMGYHEELSDVEHRPGRTT